MSPPQALPLRHALALGLLHGPAELLPVSSAGHTTLVPWLAGWPYAQLDGELRKSFEVALHAGTAAALLLRSPTPWEGTRNTALLATAVAPPALVGYALHTRIEQRLGTPGAIAAGLLAGSLAMTAAELSADRPGWRGASRTAREAGARDGLVLGLAQAVALAPGVSRSGATLAAARALGFTAREADRLSWRVGLPVIGGAALLQGSRLARRGAPPGMRVALLVGALGAFASTSLATRLLGPERRARVALPASVYRTALAALVLARASGRRRMGALQS